MPRASMAIASYDRIADILLLDRHRPGDVQIEALGMIHSWEIDRKIVESVRIVCTENLNSHIMVMKPAKDWV